MLRRRSPEATAGDGAAASPKSDVPPEMTEAEYEALVAAYVDSVAPRPAVPSEREVAAGLAPEGFEFKPTPPPPPPPRVSPLRRLATTLGGLNPRAIAETGPIRPLILLSLVTFAGAWDEVGFAFLVVFIRSDLDFDFAYLGTILALSQLVTRLAAPLAGFVGDRVSRVWMVRVGSLLANGLTMASGLAPSTGYLALGRMGMAAGTGVEQPANLPLLADHYTPENRVRVYAFQGIARALATSVGLLILVLLFLYAGITWRTAMIGFGGVGMLFALLTFTLKDPVRGATDRKAVGLSAEAAAREQRPVSWAEAWRTLSSIATLRRIWYSAPFIAAAQTGLATLLFVVLTVRIQSGADLGPGSELIRTRFGIAIQLLVPGFLTIFGLAFSAPMAARMMRRSPSGIMVFAGGAMAVQAIAMLGFLISPWIFAAIVFSWVAQAIIFIVLPMQNTLLSVVIPARVRAQGMQSHMPWSVLGVLLVPVIGRLADEYGPITAAYGMIPIFLVGAFILMSGAASVERDMRAALAASAADEEARAARRRGANKMIVCRDVDVTYDGTQVLFNIDFDVEEGELIALLGTNGAGKSTLLRAICGAQHASNGAVFLDGEDVTHKPPHENASQGVVFVPGGRAIFPTLSVRENLRAAAWLYRAEEEYVAQRIEEVLEFFPALRQRLEVQAGDMSGGEQQMLALGQAFLMRPRLLMIDELSLGLAPSIVEKLLDVVRSIHAQGTTVILVEQSVNVALTVAERAVFMDKGTIRFDGPTEELLARPDLVRSVFLGNVESGRGRVTAARARAATAEEAAERVLWTQGIGVGYGGVRALADVDVEIAAREIVGIIGPNGAGKTTLFDVVSGFLAPDEGAVWLSDVDATGLSPDARARLGLARSFQAARLFPSMTTRENIAVAVGRKRASHNPIAAASWLPGVRKAERRVAQRVEVLIELFGLGAFADKFVNELSTGSRRLVDIACVTAVDPRLLLLDEPSSGLAQAEIEILGPVVQRFAAETGCAVLVIEHDIPLVTSMATRMYAMELGQVIAEGTPTEVLNNARVKSAYLNASSSVIGRSGDRLGKALSALEDVAADERAVLL